MSDIINGNGINGAGETMTTAGMSAQMKTYYERRLIDNAEPNLVHDQFAAKYPIPKNGGKQIEFRRYSRLPKALNTLTEGVTPAGNRLNVTTVTSEVAQYGDYIEISDVLELTAIDRNIEEATKLLGAQAGRTLDTITREVVTAGTNKLFAPKVAANGTETEVLLRADLDETALLTPKLIRRAAAKLKRENANPIKDGYVAVIHPDVSCDLQGNSEWIESHKYATPENIYNGEIGKIANVRFVETTEAKIIGPAEIFEGACRLTLKTATSGSANTIAVDEAITEAQASEIAAGTKLYVDGNEIEVASVAHGEAGSAVITAVENVPAAAVGSVVCGVGAGKKGEAVYCTLVIGDGAYGVTDVEGGGLQHIVKQLGSGGTTDPLNQRATTGWKAMKTAERLVEENMVRIEHCAAEFSKTARSN